MKWEKVKLKDIAAPIKYPIGDGDHGSIKPSQYVKEGVPYIRVADISWNGDIVEKNMAFISEQLNNANAKSKLYPNDIIISKTGATIGKVAIIPDSYEVANTTASIGKVTIDKTKAYVRYVFWAMKEKEFQRQMWAVSVKSAQPGFNVIDLKNFEIYLPPLPLQRKIAAILDEADTVRRKDKALLAKYDELLQAVFYDMFGDPVKNDKGWEVKKLHELIIPKDKINYGVVQPGEDHPNGIPIVRIGDFENMLINQQKIKKISPEIEATYKKSRLFGDEILIACVGATIGKIALVDESCKGFNIVRATARVRLDTAKANRFFVGFLLSTEIIQEYFIKETRTVSQPTLNISHIENTPILCPPMGLQDAYAQIALNIQKQKSQIIQQQTYSENLFQSLMWLAFKGELVLL